MERKEEWGKKENKKRRKKELGGPSLFRLISQCFYDSLP